MAALLVPLATAQSVAATTVVALALATLLWCLAEAVVKPLWLMRHYAAQGLRGTRFVPLIGDLWRVAAMRRHAEYYLTLFRESRVAFGRLNWMFFGPQFRLRVLDLPTARAILTTHAAAFEKPSLMRRILGVVLGEGLVLSEGAVWRRHRTMINPAFHHHRLRGMAELMTRAAAKLAARWASPAATTATAGTAAGACAAGAGSAVGAAAATSRCAAARRWCGAAAASGRTDPRATNRCVARSQRHDAAHHR